MKRLLKILLFLTFGQTAFGQLKKQSCNCPAGQDVAHQGAPEKTFYFKNGKQIGLCGDVDLVNKDTIYSEVILYHCGEDGFFRDWDGIETCKITQEEDSIVVQPLVGLPVGKNMEIVSTTFRIEKYFYKGARFVMRSTYRDDLVKYTAVQINEVLDQYSKLTRGDYDKLLLVERRLFWAFFSGSAQAGKYLEGFEQKFGPFVGEGSEGFEEAQGLYWFCKLDHMMEKNGHAELVVP